MSSSLSFSDDIRELSFSGCSVLMSCFFIELSASKTKLNLGFVAKKASGSGFSRTDFGSTSIAVEQGCFIYDPVKMDCLRYRFYVYYQARLISC